MQNKSFFIIYEVRVKDSALADKLSFSDVNNVGTGPASLSSKKVSDGYTVFSEPNPERGTLISDMGERFGFIIHAPASKSLVYVLDVKNKSQESDWSQWARPNYIEDHESAPFTFIYNQKNKERSTEIPTSAPEVRFRIVKVKGSSEERFKEHQKQKELEKKSEIQLLRQKRDSGEIALSCQVLALDPRATQEDFMKCKDFISSQDQNNKWTHLSTFLSGDRFVAWHNDELTDKKVEREWIHQKPAIPSDYQAWFMKEFFTAWLQLDHAEILDSCFSIRMALEEMQLRQDWTEDAKNVVRKELKQNIIERIEKAVQEGQPDENKSFHAGLLVKALKNPEQGS